MLFRLGDVSCPMTWSSGPGDVLETVCVGRTFAYCFLISSNYLPHSFLPLCFPAACILSLTWQLSELNPRPRRPALLGSLERGNAILPPDGRQATLN